MVQLAPLPAQNPTLPQHTPSPSGPQLPGLCAPTSFVVLIKCIYSAPTWAGPDLSQRLHLALLRQSWGPTYLSWDPREPPWEARASSTGTGTWLSKLGVSAGPSPLGQPLSPNAGPFLCSHGAATGGGQGWWTGLGPRGAQQRWARVTHRSMWPQKPLWSQGKQGCAELSRMSADHSMDDNGCVQATENGM